MTYGIVVKQLMHARIDEHFRRFPFSQGIHYFSPRSEPIVHKLAEILFEMDEAIFFIQKGLWELIVDTNGDCSVPH